MNHNPKLIYNIASGRWLLEFKDNLWAFAAITDAMTVGGYLKITVIDQNSSDFLIVSKGQIEVLAAEENQLRCKFTPLNQNSSAFEDVILPEDIDIGLVECVYGFHSDKWVEVEAVMGLENVKTIGLKLFLPDNGSAETKSLNCSIKGKTILETDLSRGEPNEIWVDIPDTSDIRQELVIKTSYKEPNAEDERDLGMIFVEFNVNLTDWKPAEIII